MSILAILLGIVYFPLATTRKKANLIAGQAYVRSVAASIEGLRDTAGRLPTHLTDCVTGFGFRPKAITECTILYQNDTDFAIEATLKDAPIRRVIYKSSDGSFSSIP